MQMIQLDFFAKTSEELSLLEVCKLRDEVSNLRRGMFARHGELYKNYSEMQEVIQLQKKQIDEMRSYMVQMISQNNSQFNEKIG